jgi:enoyl-CoA hydratase/carnithine racemase
VHEVVPDSEVESRAYSVARTLASRAQVSLRGGKALIDRAVAGDVDEDEQVLALYHQSWTSAEYAEGVSAFLAKRPPDFRGARA